LDEFDKVLKKQYTGVKWKELQKLIEKYDLFECSFSLIWIASVVLEVNWEKFQSKLEKKNIKTGNKTETDREHLRNVIETKKDKSFQEIMMKKKILHQVKEIYNENHPNEQVPDEEVKFEDEYDFIKKD
jgi:hypothetical protein